MAHAQKPDFVYRRNGRVHLNRRGRQFSRLLAAEVCVSAVCNAEYTTFRWSVRVLATHSIRQFPLHFPSRASPCAIGFQTHYTYVSEDYLEDGSIDVSEKRQCFHITLQHFFVLIRHLFNNAASS